MRHICVKLLLPMRLLATFFLTLSCLFYSFSQTNNTQLSLNNESKIIELLGQEKFDQMVSINPGYLKYLDARCEAFTIIDFSEEKFGYLKPLQTLVKRNPSNKSEGNLSVSPAEMVQEYNDGNFNILLYDFYYDKSEYTYYRIGDTGKIIMIYPVDQIIKNVD